MGIRNKFGALIHKLNNKKVLAFIVFLSSAAVVLGQVAETRPKYFQEYLDAVGRYLDPIQYMVGLLLINFIFIILTIKKHETIPNQFLNTLKWYFTTLFVNDFLILLFKVVQRSNLINLSSGFTGIGKAYLVLASVRSLTELIVTSAATLILAGGLANYRSLSMQDYVISDKLKKFLMVLIVANCLIAIPLSFTGFLESRAVFAWSLILSQIAQVATAGLIYWFLRELEQVYTTTFFRYFARVFGINLILSLFTFTYSIGSFQLLQQYASGGMDSLGGYGQLIYNASIFVQILLNYYIFQALYNYGESYHVSSAYNENESGEDSVVDSRDEQESLIKDEHGSGDSGYLVTES